MAVILVENKTRLEVATHLSVHAEVHGCGSFSRVKVVDENRVLGDLVTSSVPPHNRLFAVHLPVQLVHRAVVLHVHSYLRGLGARVQTRGVSARVEPADRKWV